MPGLALIAMGISLMQEVVLHHARWIVGAKDGETSTSDTTGTRYIMKRHVGIKETPLNKTGRKRHYGRKAREAAAAEEERRRRKALQKEKVRFADITSLSSVTSDDDDESDFTFNDSGEETARETRD